MIASKDFSALILLEKLFKAWLAVAVIMLALKPTSLGTIEVIEFEEPLSVKIPVNAPPFAAISDEEILPLETIELKLPTGRQVIAAIEESEVTTLVSFVASLEMARNLSFFNSRLAEIQVEQSFQKSMTKPVVPTVTLEGMTISSIDDQIKEQSTTLVDLVEPDSHSVSESFAQRWRSLEGLSVSLNSELVAANDQLRESQNHQVAESTEFDLSRAEYEEDSKAVSVVTQKMIEAYEKSQSTEVTKLDNTKQKWVGSIYVAAGQDPAPHPDQISKSLLHRETKSKTDSSKDNSQEKPSERIARNDTPKQVLPSGSEGFVDNSNGVGFLGSPEDVTSSSSVAALVDSSPKTSGDSVASDWPEATTIVGSLTLKSGLAHLGDSTSLKVYRYIAGGPFEEGNVDKYQGTYEIEIQDPSMGTLVVEVRDKDEQVIGIYETPLFDLESKIKSGQSNVVHNITVLPVDEVLSANVKVIESSLAEVNAKGSVEISETNTGYNIDSKGVFKIKDVLMGSHFFARLNSGSFWKGMFHLSSVSKQGPKFPGSDLLKSIESQVTNHGFDYTKGIVWGQVLSGESPIENAEMEITFKEAVGPIYLGADGKIQKSGTGNNGYFLFANVDPGIHLVRGNTGTRVLSPKIVQVEPGTVTNVNLERGNKIRAEAFVFDGTTGDAIDASIRYVGSDRVANTVNGYLPLSYNQGSGFVQVEVRSHKVGYEPVRATLDRTDRTIAIPLPQSQILSSVAGSEKVVNKPDLSRVIGFVQNDRYRIYPPKSMINEDTSLVYFNQNGESKPNNEWADPGDAFIIFNATPGLHNLIIENSKGRYALKLLATDPTTTSVVTHRF